MTTTLIILGIVLCTVLYLRQRSIEHNRLDKYGIRAEMMSWLMFVLFLISAPKWFDDIAFLAFVGLICSSRIISSVSNLLGHPCSKHDHC